MGKLIDKLKELLFGNKTKMLPEGENREVNYRNNVYDFRQQQRTYNQHPHVRNPYLEYALTTYFDEYLKQIINSETTGIIPNSYGVLNSINTLGGNANKNEYFENKLLKKIQLEKKYYTTDMGTFYHIKSMNHEMPDDKDMVRIYLNCRNENVAKLTQQLLDNNTNPNYYLKVQSTDSMKKKARPDKIIIYTDDSHLNQDAKNILDVKMANPELFEDSDKMNPFIQQFENTFSVIRQPENDNYEDLKGNRIRLISTANNFISQILQDSYTETVQDIAKMDPNLRFLLKDSNRNNYNLYIENYPYINSNYHDKLINSMETNMKVLAHNNNITIKGVSPNTLKEQEKSDGYR